MLVFNEKQTPFCVLVASFFFELSCFLYVKSSSLTLQASNIYLCNHFFFFTYVPFPTFVYDGFNFVLHFLIL
jgi:hypothetical protein